MKKSSKKFIALLLSAIMLVTSIPLGAFIASAADGDAKDKYLFAYFTGNSVSGQRIRFAVSEDGYNYNALNGNAPVITQNLGTKCSRDPYIFEGQDGAYYLICTDMDSSVPGPSGNYWSENSKSFVIWKSTDLINWTDEKIIDVSAITGTNVTRAWAPQVIWSEADQKYMVYFGLQTGINTATKMYYMLTKDLMDQGSYSQPVAMLSSYSNDSIDGDIWYDANNSRYILYFKDETVKDIYYAVSSDIKGPYTVQKKLLADGLPALEGGNCFKLYNSDKLVMIADAYNNGYFVVAESTDYENFTILDGSQYSVNQLSPRHGSVINITTEQYNKLVTAYGASTSDNIEYTWGNSHSASKDWAWIEYTDVTEHSVNFKTATVSGSVNAGNSQITFSNMGALAREDAVRSILMGREFLASFVFSLDSASSANAPVYTISSGATDYIKLQADGQFFVNGSLVGSVSIENGVKNSYIVSYNGSEVALYQNGEKKLSTAATLNIQNDTSVTGGSLFAGIGYADSVSDAEYIHGTYGKVTFSAKAISSEYNVGELLSLMDEFKTKLAAGKLYTNMGNAYAAYVQCQKAYDAYYYGGNTTVDLTAAATALRAEMILMTPWTAATFNGQAYHCKTVATGGYSNVVYQKKYAPGDGSNEYTQFGNEASFSIGSSWGTTYYVKFKLALPSIIVMADDGINPISSPILTEAFGGGKPNIQIHLRYIALDSANNANYKLQLNQNWAIGSSWTAWVNPEGNAKLPKDIITDYGKGTYVDDNYSGSNRYCYNRLYFNSLGNGNTVNYYEKFTQDDISVRAGVTQKQNAVNSYWDAGGENIKTTSSQQYIINYKAVNSAIDSLKTKLSDKDVSKYKEGGLASIYNALDLLTANNCNPNTYDYSGDTAQAVKNCANAIKTAVEDASKASVGNADSTDYESLRTAIETHNAVTNVEGCPNLKTEYETAFRAAQTTMSAVYSADKTATYDQPEQAAANASQLNTAAVKYAESFHVYSWDNYDKNSGKVTFKCSSCEHSYQLDGQNYMTAAMIYDTLDSSKYTADAWKVIVDHKDEFDEIKTVRHVDPYTQTKIDRVTGNLLNAINNPIGGDKDHENNKFIITHKVVLDNVEISSVDIPGVYGATTPITYTGPGAVTSWDVQVASSPVKTVATDEKTYLLLVQDNTIITTYIRSDAAETYVNILDQYGKVLYSVPAAEGDAITCNGNTVTIAGNPYTVPNMPYMNVTEYTVNGVKYTSETEFKVKAGENKIVPKYDPVVSDYTITADGADVTVNGNATNKAEYDDVVTVTFPEGTYAVAIKNSDDSYAVAAYGNTYTFFANRHMTFYAVNGSASNYTIGTTALDKDKDALTIHRLDYQLPFAYSEVTCTDTEANKYTTFSSYSMEVPAGVTILEKGTLVSRTAGLTDETFRIGMDGVSQAVNANTAKYGNQYSLSIRNGGSVTTRAYVKYTYTYQGKEITAVSYGNICNAQ